ncbi:MAG: GTPase [Lachnospiraceae bacterium]|nr:GTPase [Lachnospiraceae bacterium]
MADYELEDDMIPVFLINGFLEAGKTKFLQFTMSQEYFRTEGKTLLIVCEEGDTEYDEELLKETGTTAVYLEDFRQMTPDYLTELELLNNPERVLIEWNGMWNQDELKLPKDWAIYQQITILDGSTLNLYLANMKPLLGAMLRGSELVICNRCDGVSDEVLTAYRRTIRAMCQKGQLVLEDEEGEIQQEMLEEDLPYDVNAPVIRIEPEDFGLWYFDCMDVPSRYEGKTVEFTGMVLKSPEFPKNYFVPGRMAMTCCEADMTFIGYVCKSKEARKLETKQWVRVKAKVAYEFWQDYGEKGPVLYAESVEPAEEIKGYVQF